MDTIPQTCTVFEKMPVKILNVAQNCGFLPFEGQDHAFIFSYIKNAPSLTKRRRLRYCA